ncbi:hypothetical protein JYK21_07185 [Ralstonia pickettii]|nr:hypothetical protein [Ralstonia pickettii]
MNLHEHFLPNDMVQASKEYKCFKDCLKQVHIQMDKGNIEIAKHRTIDMLKSLHELSKLSEKKYRVECYKHLLQHMNTVGVNIELVRGFNHER